MKISTPECILDARAILGEGPAWDTANERLYWVDIIPGHLHIYQPESGADRSSPWPGPGLRRPGQQRPPGAGAQGRPGPASTPRAPRSASWRGPRATCPATAFNDGKVTPDGRFLAGGVDNAEVEAGGALYSLSPDGALKTLLTGVRISNGLAWSPDHKTLYYIDTPTRQVMAYDYDLTSGDIANPRVAVNLPDGLGWPDGVTSDASGRLWVALWGSTGPDGLGPIQRRPAGENRDPRQKRDILRLWRPEPGRALPSPPPAKA